MTESRFSFLERYPHFPAVLAKKAREAETDCPGRFGASLVACRTAAEKITEFLLIQTGLPAKGMIANPFYSPANPCSKPELDLSKQADRLFVLLKEEIISYQDKTERFDFIRLKGNAAAHEDAENPYTEADAAAALDHLHALCRQLAEHYPAAQPPRAPRCFANPAAAQPLQNRAAPYRSGSGMAAGMTIAAVIAGVLFVFYILSSLAKRPSEKRETAAAPAAPAPENNILRYPDGSVYRGGIVNGLAEAENGKITYPDGGTCEGRFSGGKLNGQAVCRYADGGSYQGGFANGLRSGQGKITYPDGVVYTGGFSGGDPDGQGEITAGNNRYTGYVSRDGIPAGEGVLITADGGCAGRFTRSDAACRFDDGSRYRGGFDGKKLNFAGQGILTDAEGRIRFKGEWLAGEPVKSSQTEEERLRAQAEAGDAEAQNALGNLYAEGKQVPKDDKTAALWYFKATKQGLAAAQYQLGTMYEQGRGVGRAADAAAAWYLAAATQHYAPAVARLKAAAETAPPEKNRPSGGDTLDELF
ncbi:tetratricopeptide repeat protein [Neisseria bacilliformis]|uniref:tetratricopeptide repeat protein n=1 Tax=Neisseria bacilliformis TaxID=267212 RepID=UPI000668F62F|nr:tetratricopeptide repeat protein [Neisseria bacilliformis]